MSLANTCSIGLRSSCTPAGRREGAGRGDGGRPPSSYGRSVVQDDDVAGPQGGDQAVADLGQEGGGVVAPSISQAASTPPSEGGQEGRGVPVAVRHRPWSRLRRAAPGRGAVHRGLGPGLVNEDQPRRVDPMELATTAPAGASARVGPARPPAATFFSLDPLGLQEAPHRVVRDPHSALLPERVLQLVQRRLRTLPSAAPG